MPTVSQPRSRTMMEFSGERNPSAPASWSLSDWTIRANGRAEHSGIIGDLRVTVDVADDVHGTPLPLPGWCDPCARRSGWVMRSRSSPMMFPFGRLAIRLLGREDLEDLGGLGGGQVADPVDG